MQGSYRSRSPISNGGRSGSGGNSGFNEKEMRICDMPTAVRYQLCDHLDSLNEWYQLAQLMQLPPEDILIIEREVTKKHSPTNMLLQIWGQQYGHNVTELFGVLKHRKLFEAMRIIKSCVARKFHIYIPDSKPQFSLLMRQSNQATTTANNNFYNSSSNNDTQTSGKILNVNASGPGLSDSNKRMSLPKVPQQDSNYLNEHDVKQSACTIEISYEELRVATNNWSKHLQLGNGGFGTVYRGIWKHTEVAIKQLQYKGKNGEDCSKVQLQQSLNELKYLSACRHDNILPLYAYSLNGEQPCLVYQLMKGGTLNERLYDRKHEPLTWEQRLDICLGTARGINFLHTFRDKPLIHGDIKPANVLLDVCLQPKIGDFGLAREGPQAVNSTVVVSRIFGTKPYLPPEYLCLKELSTQMDTYSFGVVMLQTFTGLKAHDEKPPNTFLTEHIWEFFATPGNNITDLIDKRQPVNEWERELCVFIIQLAAKCIAKKAGARPEMESVLNEMERLKLM